MHIHVSSTLRREFTRSTGGDISKKWSIAMTRSILLILAATMIALGAAPSLAYSDRNNEPICSQPGNVDPRCF
jgi:hypothetical protein